MVEMPPDKQELADSVSQYAGDMSAIPNSIVAYKLVHSLSTTIACSQSNNADSLTVVSTSSGTSSEASDASSSTSTQLGVAINNIQQTEQSDDNTSIEKCTFCVCCRCGQPIRDKYLYKVLDQNYHETCLRCADCQLFFSKTCFSRHGNIYCRKHFLKHYGPKCSGCLEFISEQSAVRKANNHVYHVDCFQCLICKKQFSTGDQFYLIPVDGRLVCRNDFETFTNKESEMDCGNKRPRTTISAKSLDILRQAYQNSSKPARHIREQLAIQTGLDMRVVQVWFQNRRAKEKRLKKDAGRRWNNAAGCANGGDPLGMTGDGVYAGDGSEGVRRALDSDSASNDESLTGRSPLYGVSGYVDTSSDLDIRSELSYDPNYISDSAVGSTAALVNGCGGLPPPTSAADSILSGTPNGEMHSLMHGAISIQGQLPNAPLNNSLYVDVHAISTAVSNAGNVCTPATSIALADPDNARAGVHFVGRNPLLPPHSLHGAQLSSISQQQQSSPISTHHLVPDQQQQFAAAATAAHQQQQEQQQHLHQLHQQQQLILLQQQRQHYLDIDQQRAQHHGLSPFHSQHILHTLPTTDAAIMYAPQ